MALHIMARIKPIRYCKGCGMQITTRTRCEPCRKERRKEIDREFARRHSPVPATRDQYYKEQRAKGAEYESQQHSRYSDNYLIYVGNKLTPVKKLCNHCKKDDAAVRGRWAPIYSSQDARGNETKPVLLCLDCYEKECDRY